MKKTVSYFLILSIISCSQSYVPFEPIVYEQNGDVRKIDLDSSLVPNLIFVLEHYEEKYQITKNGQLLVTKRLAQNTDMLYNFHSKAKDSTWLLARRGK